MQPITILPVVHSRNKPASRFPPKQSNVHFVSDVPGLPRRGIHRITRASCTGCDNGIFKVSTVAAGLAPSEKRRVVSMRKDVTDESRKIVITPVEMVDETMARYGRRSRESFSSFASGKSGSSVASGTVSLHGKSKHLSPGHPIYYFTPDGDIAQVVRVGDTPRTISTIDGMDQGIPGGESGKASASPATPNKESFMSTTSLPALPNTIVLSSKSNAQTELDEEYFQTALASHTINTQNPDCAACPRRKKTSFQSDCSEGKAVRKPYDIQQNRAENRTTEYCENYYRSGDVSPEYETPRGGGGDEPACYGYATPVNAKREDRDSLVESVRKTLSEAFDAEPESRQSQTPREQAGPTRRSRKSINDDCICRADASGVHLCPAHNKYPIDRVSSSGRGLRSKYTSASGTRDRIERNDGGAKSSKLGSPMGYTKCCDRDIPREVEDGQRCYSSDKLDCQRNSMFYEGDFQSKHQCSPIDDEEEIDDYCGDQNEERVGNQCSMKPPKTCECCSRAKNGPIKRYARCSKVLKDYGQRRHNKASHYQSKRTADCEKIRKCCPEKTKDCQRTLNDCYLDEGERTPQDRCHLHCDEERSWSSSDSSSSECENAIRKCEMSPDDDDEFKCCGFTDCRRVNRCDDGCSQRPSPSCNDGERFKTRPECCHSERWKSGRSCFEQKECPRINRPASDGFEDRCVSSGFECSRQKDTNCCPNTETDDRRTNRCPQKKKDFWTDDPRYCQKNHSPRRPDCLDDKDGRRGCRKEITDCEHPNYCDETPRHVSGNFECSRQKDTCLSDAERDNKDRRRKRRRNCDGNERKRYCGDSQCSRQKDTTCVANADRGERKNKQCVQKKNDSWADGQRCPQKNQSPRRPDCSDDKDGRRGCRGHISNCERPNYCNETQKRVSGYFEYSRQKDITCFSDPEIDDREYRPQRRRRNSEGYEGTRISSDFESSRQKYTNCSPGANRYERRNNPCPQKKTEYWADDQRYSQTNQSPKRPDCCDDKAERRGFKEKVSDCDRPNYCNATSTRTSGDLECFRRKDTDYFCGANKDERRHNQCPPKKKECWADDQRYCQTNQSPGRPDRCDETEVRPQRNSRLSQSLEEREIMAAARQSIGGKNSLPCRHKEVKEELRRHSCPSTDCNAPDPSGFCLYEVDSEQPACADAETSVREKRYQTVQTESFDLTAPSTCKRSFSIEQGTDCCNVMVDASTEPAAHGGSNASSDDEEISDFQMSLIRASIGHDMPADRLPMSELLRSRQIEEEIKNIAVPWGTPPAQRKKNMSLQKDVANTCPTWGLCRKKSNLKTRSHFHRRSMGGWEQGDTAPKRPLGEKWVMWNENNSSDTEDEIAWVKPRPSKKPNSSPEPSPRVPLKSMNPGFSRPCKCPKKCEKRTRGHIYRQYFNIQEPGSDVGDNWSQKSGVSDDDPFYRQSEWQLSGNNIANQPRPQDGRRPPKLKDPRLRHGPNNKPPPKLGPNGKKPVARTKDEVLFFTKPPREAPRSKREGVKRRGPPKEMPKEPSSQTGESEASTASKKSNKKKQPHEGGDKAAPHKKAEISVASTGKKKKKDDKKKRDQSKEKSKKKHPKKGDSMMSLESVGKKRKQGGKKTGHDHSQEKKKKFDRKGKSTKTQKHKIVHSPRAPLKRTLSVQTDGSVEAFPEKKWHYRMDATTSYHARSPWHSPRDAMPRSPRGRVIVRTISMQTDGPVDAVPERKWHYAKDASNSMEGSPIYAVKSQPTNTASNMENNSDNRHARSEPSLVQSEADERSEAASSAARAQSQAAVSEVEEQDGESNTTKGSKKKKPPSEDGKKKKKRGRSQDGEETPSEVSRKSETVSAVIPPQVYRSSQTAAASEIAASEDTAVSKGSKKKKQEKEDGKKKKREHSQGGSETPPDDYQSSLIAASEHTVSTKASKKKKRGSSQDGSETPPDQRSLTAASENSAASKASKKKKTSSEDGKTSKGDLLQEATSEVYPNSEAADSAVTGDTQASKKSKQSHEDEKIKERESLGGAESQSEISRKSGAADSAVSAASSKVSKKSKHQQDDGKKKKHDRPAEENSELRSVFSQIANPDGASTAASGVSKKQKEHQKKSKTSSLGNRSQQEVNDPEGQSGSHRRSKTSTSAERRRSRTASTGLEGSDRRQSQSHPKSKTNTTADRSKKQSAVNESEDADEQRQPVGRQISETSTITKELEGYHVSQTSTAGDRSQPRAVYSDVEGVDGTSTASGVTQPTLDLGEWIKTNVPIKSEPELSVIETPGSERMYPLNLDHESDNEYSRNLDRRISADGSDRFYSVEGETEQMESERGASRQTLESQRGPSRQTLESQRGTSRQTVGNQSAASRQTVGFGVADEGSEGMYSSAGKSKRGTSKQTVESHGGVSIHTLDRWHSNDGGSERVYSSEGEDENGDTQRGTSRLTVNNQRGASRQTVESQRGTSRHTVDTQRGASRQTVDHPYSEDGSGLVYGTDDEYEQEESQRGTSRQTVGTREGSSRQTVGSQRGTSRQTVKSQRGTSRQTVDYPYSEDVYITDGEEEHEGSQRGTSRQTVRSQRGTSRQTVASQRGSSRQTDDHPYSEDGSGLVYGPDDEDEYEESQRGTSRQTVGTRGGSSRQTVETQRGTSRQTVGSQRGTSRQTVGRRLSEEGSEGFYSTGGESKKGSSKRGTSRQTVQTADSRFTEGNSERFYSSVGDDQLGERQLSMEQSDRYYGSEGESGSMRKKPPSSRQTLDRRHSAESSERFYSSDSGNGYVESQRGTSRQTIESQRGTSRQTVGSKRGHSRQTVDTHLTMDGPEQYYNSDGDNEDMDRRFSKESSEQFYSSVGDSKQGINKRPFSRQGVDRLHPSETSDRYYSPGGDTDQTSFRQAPSGRSIMSSKASSRSPGKPHRQPSSVRSNGAPRTILHSPGGRQNVVYYDEQEPSIEYYDEDESIISSYNQRGQNYIGSYNDQGSGFDSYNGQGSVGGSYNDDYEYQSSASRQTVDRRRPPSRQAYEKQSSPSRQALERGISSKHSGTKLHDRPHRQPPSGRPHSSPRGPRPPGAPPRPQPGSPAASSKPSSATAGGAALTGDASGISVPGTSTTSNPPSSSKHPSEAKFGAASSTSNGAKVSDSEESSAKKGPGKKGKGRSGPGSAAGSESGGSENSADGVFPPDLQSKGSPKKQKGKGGSKEEDELSSQQGQGKKKKGGKSASNFGDDGRGGGADLSRRPSKESLKGSVKGGRKPYSRGNEETPPRSRFNNGQGGHGRYGGSMNDDRLNPAGVVIFQLACRYATFGGIRVAGGVRVLMDAPEQMGYVQIISPLGQAFITHYVNTLSFLHSSSAAGVAWSAVVWEVKTDDNNNKGQKGSGRDDGECPPGRVDSAQAVFCEPYQAHRFRAVLETIRAAFSNGDGAVIAPNVPPVPAPGCCPPGTPGYCPDPCPTCPDPCNPCPPPPCNPCPPPPSTAPSCFSTAPTGGLNDSCQPCPPCPPPFPPPLPDMGMPCPSFCVPGSVSQQATNPCGVPPPFCTPNGAAGCGGGGVGCARTPCRGPPPYPMAGPSPFPGLCPHPCMNPCPEETDPYAYTNSYGKTLFCQTACLVKLGRDDVWQQMHRGSLMIIQEPNCMGYSLVLVNDNQNVLSVQKLSRKTEFKPTPQTQNGFLYNAVTTTEKGSLHENFLVCFLCKTEAEQFRCVTSNCRRIMMMTAANCNGDTSNSNKRRPPGGSTVGGGNVGGGGGGGGAGGGGNDGGGGCGGGGVKGIRMCQPPGAKRGGAVPIRECGGGRTDCITLGASRPDKSGMGCDSRAVASWSGATGNCGGGYGRCGEKLEKCGSSNGLGNGCGGFSRSPDIRRCGTSSRCSDIVANAREVKSRCSDIMSNGCGGGAGGSAHSSARLSTACCPEKRGSACGGSGLGRTPSCYSNPGCGSPPCDSRYRSAGARRSNVSNYGAGCSPRYECSASNFYTRKADIRADYSQMSADSRSSYGTLDNSAVE